MTFNKKNTLMLLVPLAFVLMVALYYSFIYQHKYAGILWPRSTKFEVTGDDIAIELKENFATFDGQWPRNTLFFVSQNQIKEIEVSSDFSFLDFNFKKGALISINDETYEMYVKADYSIDGMKLSEECLLRFKKRVLHSAKCPNEEQVNFKRFMSPSSLDFSLDGEVKEVE